MREREICGYAGREGYVQVRELERMRVMKVEKKR